jgi:hypothetical protein
MDKQWVELTVDTVTQVTYYVGEVDSPFEESVLLADKNSYVKLENTRWLDIETKEVVKYSDYQYARDNTIYFLSSTILAVSLIKKEDIPFWDIS